NAINLEWYPQSPPTEALLDGEQFWFGDAHVQSTAMPPTFSKFLDLDQTSMPWSWDSSHQATRHPNQGQNFVFGDGHAATLAWDNYQAMDPLMARRLTGQPWPWPHY